MINRFTTVAGKTIFVRLAGSSEAEKGRKRKEKSNPTAAAVEEQNRKKSERDLSILVNYNFTAGDLHIVLTHKGAEPTAQEAKRMLDNFKKSLRRRYRKKGIELKWICTTEFENTRIHHHMIINKGLPIEEIAEIWGAGIVRTSVLDKSGDYRKLANYLIKETGKTFRAEGAVQRQRYSCSKTIERPVTKKESVSAAALFRDPKPVKGYYIDQDSIYKGNNPATEQPYMEYVMVSLDAEPRLQIWPRGKRVHDMAGDIWLKGQRKEMQLGIETGPANDAAGYL